MTPFQRIADKLRGCGRELKPAGSWLTTLCPVHADTNASLGIKEDPETGKAVVKCFAGCKDTEILRAIGLEVRDLFPETSSPARDIKKSDGALTLAQLAEAKKLPVEFLRSLGVVDFKGGVVMPYYMPEPQAQIAEAQQTPRSSGDTPKPATTAKPLLRNHEVFTYANKNGDLREGIKAIPILQIGKTLLDATSNWPRRVEALLFSDENGTIRYFESRDDLFAWVQERMALFWQVGLDDNTQSLVSRGEFMSHLQAVTDKYVAVEEYPHQPQMEGHYYAWRPPQDYTATGEYLQRLVTHFDNAENESDIWLIKAAIMTPAWGGLPGKRPAFVIMAPDRGCGKSTLANSIGHLYGGHIELQLTDTAEDKLTSRLLTPSSLSKRVVRIDNIKEQYNSAFIEGLITAPTISGHRLYYGDASRPNTLTFLLTGNALRLSRDIAERAFIIRLSKPAYRAGWESEVFNFVALHRQKILADIIAELQKPSEATAADDRYADWVKNVLARSGGEPDAIVELNKERRNACDEDQDEAGAIMAAIDTHIDQIAVLDAHVFVGSGQMTEIVSKALNEYLSARSVKAKLEGHIEAGRLTRVHWKRTATQNGYVVKRPEVLA